MGISRNRLIVRALEHELAPSAGWTPGFFDSLARVTTDTADAVDALQADIRKGRRSKRPLTF